MISTKMRMPCLLLAASLSLPLMAQAADDAPAGGSPADAGGYASPSAAPGFGSLEDDARPAVAVSPEAPPPPHTAPDGATLRSSRAPGFTEDTDRRQLP